MALQGRRMQTHAGMSSTHGRSWQVQDKIQITHDCDALGAASSQSQVLFQVGAGSILPLLRDEDRDYFKVTVQGQPVYVPKSNSERIESGETREILEGSNATESDEAATPVAPTGRRENYHWEDVSGKFDRDKFLVNQKRMSFKEKYYVYGEQEEELFYVEREFKFLGKRNITVYDDDSKQSPVLYIDQTHFWEFGRREYIVYEAGGEAIAGFDRNNWTSLFRRGWDILDPSGNLIGKAREDSVALAFVRRIIDFIPFVELLGGIIKTDFHLFRVNAEGEEEKIGSFDRRLTLADKYVLNLSGDPERTLDRRTALALGVLLDTAEKR